MPTFVPLLVSSEVINVDEAIEELEKIDKFRQGFDGRAAVIQTDWMVTLLRKLLKEVKAQAEGGWQIE